MKLNNPFLRKSVAKIASLKQISAVGQVPLTDLINQLKTALGHDLDSETYNDEEYFTEKPDWFDHERVIKTIEEDKQEDQNKMTLVTILEEAKKMEGDDIIELVTTFLPAPGIDALKSKGYSVWTMHGEGSIVLTYFMKAQ